MLAQPLALTAGEPAGIGPDLILQLAQTDDLSDVVVLADHDMLAQRAQHLDLPITLVPYESIVERKLAAPRGNASGVLNVLSVELADTCEPGRLNVANAPAVVRSLELAIHGVLDGQFSGLVTAPVQKSIIMDAGFDFSGHTEFLQAHAGVDDVVMLLVADELRVALATTHLPLKRVSGALSVELLVRRLEILAQDLSDKFGISDPRILVCGLNPHAGEGGHMGREEIDVIEPALEIVKAKGVHAVGPLPADTLFTPRYLAQADAVLAMFHDQGLPVLKYAGFGQAVNVTLGLPFVRTSVDHGTALDLAGSGQADVGSLRAALQLARRLVA